jgi:hypothetical protein
MENQVRDGDVRLRHSASLEKPLHDAGRHVGPELMQPSQPSVPCSFCILCIALRVARARAVQSETNICVDATLT